MAVTVPDIRYRNYRRDKTLCKYEISIFVEVPIINPIIDWISDNTQNKWYWTYESDWRRDNDLVPCRFFFESEADSMYFTLRWK